MLLQLAAPGRGPLSDPDPLPAAPFLERYLLQDPLPTAIFLCIAAAVGWWWLQKVGKPKASWIVVAACPVLAGAVLLLARFVTTDREALAERCRTLVDDTIAARGSQVEPVLRADAVASGRNIGEISRDRILQMIAENEARRRGASDAALKWVTATIDGPNVARTQYRVQVKNPLYDTWIPTTWMIHWVRSNATAPWQVRLIEEQQIGLN